MSRAHPRDPQTTVLPAGGGQPLPQHPLHPLPRVLDVVTVIANPARFRSRYNLYRRFAEHMEDAGVRLTTVELAYGERPFEITEAGNPRHLQMRTAHELWHKENLINLGIATLPRDWRYVAWIDADVSFARSDWAQETLQELQHHDIVQLFSHCLDMGPTNVPFDQHEGFAYCYNMGKPFGQAYTFWHPGYAWAARRETIDNLGGLLDWAPLGAADHHMALALVGRGQDSIHGGVTQRYFDWVALWQARAEAHVRRNLGHVGGLLLHHWHGKKGDRRYQSRWEILVETQFDPLLDLKKDWQGLWQLTDRSIVLRDRIRRYFRTRNEDSTDL